MNDVSLASWPSPAYQFLHYVTSYPRSFITDTHLAQRDSDDHTESIGVCKDVTFLRYSGKATNSIAQVMMLQLDLS